MAVRDNMPTMLASTSASSTYSAGDLSNAFVNEGQAALGNSIIRTAIFQQNTQNPQNQLPKGVPMSQRRIVQVFIADPNENIPLDDCLIYKGEEKLTDATDQELFFELDIRTLLEQHNAKRVKIMDKKVKDRTEFLEPVKVRELKMVVVTVANL